jgi:hypothetical protein
LDLKRGGGGRGLLTARRKDEENKSIWRISSVRPSLGRRGQRGKGTGQPAERIARRLPAINRWKKGGGRVGGRNSAVEGRRIWEQSEGKNYIGLSPI